MAECVVDSSAVLAMLHREPGAERAQPLVREAIMSAINHAEVLRHLVDQGVPLAEAQYVTRRLGYGVVAADLDAAITVGVLHEQTRRRGVSIGDQFCLALAVQTRLAVVTSDKRWAEFDIGVEVRLIR